MKAARIAYGTAYIECPHCEESFVDDRTGSMMVTPDTVIQGLRMSGGAHGKVLTCENCGGKCTVPKFRWTYT